MSFLFMFTGSFLASLCLFSVEHETVMPQHCEVAATIKIYTTFIRIRKLLKTERKISVALSIALSLSG